MGAFINGVFTGASLIIAIGGQNAYVLKQGLLRQHIFIICLFCAVSDALLIAVGVSGVGQLVSHYPRLLQAVSIFGALFLFVYGLSHFRDAFKTSNINQPEQKNPKNLSRILMIVFALTYLNPHVYLDTILLIGSIGAHYPAELRIMFALGAIVASFIWFFGLGYGARLLAPLFAKPMTWKVLDVLIGIVMWLIAISLIEIAIES